MKAPIPAAALVCPTIDLNEVTPQLRAGKVFSLFNASDIPSNSVLSPTVVPVP